MINRGQTTVFINSQITNNRGQTTVFIDLTINRGLSPFYAFDLINGSERLRQWVDDPAATSDDLEAMAGADEAAWMTEQEAVMLYR